MSSLLDLIQTCNKFCYELKDQSYMVGVVGQKFPCYHLKGFSCFVYVVP